MYPYFFNVPMTASGAYLGITCATNQPRTRNWDNASHLRVVEHVKLLSCVTASVENDSFLASWVIRQELGPEKKSAMKSQDWNACAYGCDVQHLTINNDPDIVLLVVLSYIRSSEFIR